MTAVTVFGSGNMGTAIAGVLTAGGASVTHIGSADKNAEIDSDLVILAVPFGAIDDIVATYGDKLAGKVVVDISNPLDFATFDSLVVPADSSAAAVVAEKLPASRVLKAFNTNFASTLASTTVGSVPTTVLVAGDDAEAKATLINLVAAGGVAAVDAGSLKRARELEAVGFLQLTLAIGEKVSWTGGFALVK